MIRLHRWNRKHPPTAREIMKILEDMGYRCHTYTYPPGTVFPPHQHSVDKIDAVITGRFRIQIFTETEEQPIMDVILEAGDMIEIPAGTLHRAEVTGQKPVLSIDAIRHKSGQDNPA